MLWMRAPFRKATGSLQNDKLCTLRDHFLSLAYKCGTRYRGNRGALDSPGSDLALHGMEHSSYSIRGTLKNGKAARPRVFMETAD